MAACWYTSRGCHVSSMQKADITGKLSFCPPTPRPSSTISYFDRLYAAGRLPLAKKPPSIDAPPCQMPTPICTYGRWHRVFRELWPQVTVRTTTADRAPSSGSPPGSPPLPSWTQSWLSYHGGFIVTGPRRLRCRDCRRWPSDRLPAATYWGQLRPKFGTQHGLDRGSTHLPTQLFYPTRIGRLDPVLTVSILFLSGLIYNSRYHACHPIAYFG